MLSPRPGLFPRQTGWFAALRPMKKAAVLFSLTCMMLAQALIGAEQVTVQGSASLMPVITSLVPLMRTEFGVELRIRAEGGSSHAINAVGLDSIQVALSSRSLTSADRSVFPKKNFTEVQIGTEIFSIVVASDVWNAGLRHLTRDQMAGIYEGRVTNWKALGGEDKALRFYCPQVGKGAWEHLARWLYTDVRQAPLGRFEVEVNESQEARDQVEFHAGGISVVPPRFIDGKRVFALGAQLPDGGVAQANQEGVASGKYPMMRPVYLISGGPPTGGVKRLFDFLLSERGREWVEKAGLLPLAPKTAAR